MARITRRSTAPSDPNDPRTPIEEDSPPSAEWPATVSSQSASRIALCRALQLASHLPVDDQTEPAVYEITDSWGRVPGCYGLPVDQPAWLVFLPWFDGLDGRCLRSSRFIAISKRDGAILYDGTALDEG